MSDLTPMMRQYRAVKDQYPDALLFFRLGDFYELFFEDALVASRELEITLTGRDGGGGERVPMCGVPYHAAETYIARLTDRGYKVAICEQMEDPRLAKGLVRREVVRVVTPGTVQDARLIGERRNRYLAAVMRQPVAAGGGWGLAAADVSTGEFLACEFRGEEAGRRLRDELARLSPAECLLDPALAGEEAFVEEVRRGYGAAVTPLPAEACSPARARELLREHFRVATLAGFGCEDKPLAVAAAGALLAYLRETQRDALPQITGLRTLEADAFLGLDAAARRNLELTARLGDGARQGSLLGVLDRTVTAMGGRLLRQWLERPLRDVAAIRARLDAVEELAGDGLGRAELREALRGVYDLERLVSRVACGTAGPRDLVALRHSLERLPRVGALLAGRGAALLREAARLLGGGDAVAETPGGGEAAAPGGSGVAEGSGGLEQVADLIRRAIVDEPPVSPNEGGLIRPGYDARVDELRRASREGKDWIAALEAAERERTGIKSLKVGFNKVFGYYIEVTHPNRHLVPPDYVRKQTLANAERYVTPELKEKEEAVLGAEERLLALEYRLFCEVREAVARHTAAIQAAARAVARADALAALAEVAVANGYVRPEVDEGLVIELKESRHPVLEQVLGPGRFVPNDVYLDGDAHRFLLITGPNMAGKSTVARQVALAVIMAQMGSFVPAARARIGVADRVFTRIGAADDLFAGQSTFMVEMTEVAALLHHATPRSLVILDEVGRGTSTFDGLSLAWAVSEDLHDRVRARTLFTTHYHELTALEELLPGVKNYTVAVRERGEEVVFLRRLVRGGADRSYGIQVARLAGLPPAVLRRALEVLRELERSEEFREARRQVAAGLGGHREAAGTGAGSPDAGVGAPAAGASVAAAAVSWSPAAGSRVSRSPAVPSPAAPPAAAAFPGAPSGQLSLLPPAHQLKALERLLELDILRLTPLEALNRLHALQALARGGEDGPAAGPGPA